MRVGELSRRTGVGIGTLRAWERRFALLNPVRSDSGQRLYTEADVERVVAVSRLVAEGLTVSAAARRVAAAGTGALATVDGEADAFLLHQIVQAADQGIWVARQGRTRYVNRRMAELMRCSTDELLARPVLDFTDPADADVISDHGQRGREGRRQRYDQRLIRPDGSTFVAEISTTPLRDPSGAYKGAVAVVSDVTSRRRDEADGRFRAALLNAIGEAVLAALPDGTIVYVNPAAEALFGWRATELIGQNGLELLAAPGDTASGARIHAGLLAKTRHRGEVTLSRSDGSTFDAHLTGSAVLDDNGTIVGVIGVLRDNTERDTLQQQLHSEQQRAETIGLLMAHVLSDTNPDRQGVLSELVEATRRVLRVDDAAVLELTPDADSFLVRVASPKRGTNVSIPAGSRSLAGYTALAGTVITVEDAAADRRFDVASPDGVDITIASAIAAPIATAHGISGVLIASRADQHQFDASAAQFIRNLAHIAAFALQPRLDAAAAPPRA
jgi:PAS domain S-box-containing protein